MKRPPTMRASGWVVLMTTVVSSGVSIDSTLSRVGGEVVAVGAEVLERPLDVGGGDRDAVGPFGVGVKLEGDRLLVL